MGACYTNPMQEDSAIIVLQVFTLFIATVVLLSSLTVIAFRNKWYTLSRYLVRFSSFYAPTDVVYLYILDRKFQEAHNYYQRFENSYYYRDTPEIFSYTKIMLLAHEGKWDEIAKKFENGIAVSASLLPPYADNLQEGIQERALDKIDSLYLVANNGQKRIRPATYLYSAAHLGVILGIYAIVWACYQLAVKLLNL